jgi:hypothetical protein
MRGYPKKIRSDAGSQLVAASKELNTMAQSWNWDAINMFGKDNVGTFEDALPRIRSLGHK